MKNASLWIAGSRPLVKSIRIMRRRSVVVLNHGIGQWKNIASPMRIAAKMRNISFVSK